MTSGEVHRCPATLLAGLALFIALGCSGASSRPDGLPRIGIVELRKVETESHLGKAFGATLKAHKRELQKTTDMRKADARNEKDEETKARKLEELNLLQSKNRHDLDEEEDDSRHILLEKAKAIAGRIGSRDGYKMILDKKGQLLWRVDAPVPSEDEAEKVDITKEIVRTLDAREP